MTPIEKYQIKAHLESGEPLPGHLAQIVLIVINAAQGHSGKRSLTYKDAIVRRNRLIKAAFDALPGRPWPRIAELSGRVISERFGDDAAGKELRLAIDTGVPIPRTVTQLAMICGLTKSPKSK